MRLFLSTLVAFIALCVPVSAQIDTQDVLADALPENAIPENIAETDTAKVINAAEGAGLIVSDINGALPQGLWRNNLRSEITYLLKNLPVNAPFKSLQLIKRNMLISNYDTSEINNDAPIKVGEDLLTLRLSKLMEMGLWEDAHALYAKTTSDPGQNPDLAQIGLLLTFYKQGIASACLEQKAFGERFTSDFWDYIRLICRAEILNEKIISTQFPQSIALKNIYSQPNYSVNADKLAPFTFLELMMLKDKGKISYQNFKLALNTPPHILRMFLSDKNFPESQKPALLSLTESKVVRVAKPLESEENPSNGGFHNQNSQNIQGDEKNSHLFQIADLVDKGTKIPVNLARELVDNAPENKENIFYLQLLRDFDLIENIPSYSEEDKALAIAAFPEKYTKEIQILKSWLDKSPEFSNNPSKVYEKQIGLLKSGEYGNDSPSSFDWTKWLGKTTSHQLAGTSLLVVLSNNKNSGVRYDQLLNDLRNVGLIEQAHQVARDMTARLMRSNKN